MEYTVVGTFDSRARAERAVRELNESGFHPDQIGFLTSSQQSDRSEPGSREAEKNENYVTDYYGGESVMAKGVTIGAATGAAFGGLGGLLVGLGALAIPGFGPIVAAGPILAALTGAGLGAGAGSLVGALVTSGIPEEESHAYTDLIRQGHVVVTAHAHEENVSDAEAILKRNGASDIDERPELSASDVIPVEDSDRDIRVRSTRVYIRPETATGFSTPENVRPEDRI